MSDLSNPGTPRPWSMSAWRENTDALPGQSIEIDGHRFAVELSKMRLVSQETLRDGVVTSAQPDDSLFNANGAWARYCFDVSSGIGAETFDLEETDQRSRASEAWLVQMWNKAGITLSETPHTLLNVAAASVAPSKGVVVSSLLSTNSIWWWVNSNCYASVYTAADPYAVPTPAAKASHNLPGGRTPNAVTTDGFNVYVATNNGICVGSPSSPSMTVLGATSGVWDNIAFVGNRLLGAKGADLYEIGAGGTTTLIRTHPSPSFRWYVIIQLGSRIYAGGTSDSPGGRVNGVQSSLYLLTTTSSGALALGPEACNFNPSDALISAWSYQGVVMLGFLGAVRVAELAGDGALVYGPRLDMDAAHAVPSGSTDAARPTSFAALNQFVYVGYANRPFLSVFNLSKFVGALNPAHIIVGISTIPTGGGNGDTVQAMLSVGPHLYYINDHGDLMFVQDKQAHGDHYRYPWFTPSYSPAGYVRWNGVHFGTIAPKRLVDQTLLLGTQNQTVAGAERYYGTTAKLEMYRPGRLGGGGPDLISGVNIGLSLSVPVSPIAYTDWLDVDHLGNELPERGEISVDMMLTLEAPLANKIRTPTVQGWRVRATPVVPPVHQWMVPIRLHTTSVIGTGNGQTLTIDVGEEYQHLVALWQTKKLVTIQIGPWIYTGRIDAFELEPTKWNDAGEFVEGTLLLRIVMV